MNNRVEPPVGGQHIFGCFAPSWLLRPRREITVPRCKRLIGGEGCLSDVVDRMAMVESFQAVVLGHPWPKDNRPKAGHHDMIFSTAISAITNHGPISKLSAGRRNLDIGSTPWVGISYMVSCLLHGRDKTNEHGPGSIAFSERDALHKRDTASCAMYASAATTRKS